MSNNYDHLLGKTITKIDASAVNFLVIYFSDGTKVEFTTEYMGHSIYGIVEYKEEGSKLNA